MTHFNTAMFTRGKALRPLISRLSLFIPLLLSTAAVLAQIQCATPSISPGVSYPLGGPADGGSLYAAWTITSADFNSDGYPDIATGNNNGPRVFILLNKGDGTFAAPVAYSPFQYTAEFITSGDINSDGKPDLALGTVNGEVAVMLNNGDGTFTSSIYTVGSGYISNSVAIADVSGDGKADLAVVSTKTSTDSYLSILINKGDGTFNAPVNYDAGANENSVTAADLDGDGRIDLAVANRNASMVSVLINGGNGIFGSPVSYAVSGKPWSVISCDINSDGKPDLLTANDNSVSVLQNNGSGIFASVTNYTTGGNHNGIIAADISGDGKPDLAVSSFNSNISLLFNKGDDTFTPPVAYPTLTNVESITTLDANRDGKPDLAVPGQFTSNVEVFFGVCASSPAVTTTPANFISVKSAQGGGNVTSDGGGALIEEGVVYSTVPHPTLSSGTKTTGGKGTYPFSPKVPNKGSFTTNLKGLSANTTYYLRAYVINGAGLSYGEDVQFTTKSTCISTALEPAVSYTAGNSPSSVVLADIDGDGYTDMVVANELSTNVSVYSNRGDGVFTGAVNYPTPAGPQAVAAIDFINNGKTSLAVAQANGHVSILGNLTSTNTGKDSFYIVGDYTTGTNAYSLTAGDIDGDGRRDLAVANFSDNTISVLHNYGSGFTITGTFPVGGSAYSVAIADLDGDGKADLAVATSNGISVLINNGSGSFGTAANYGAAGTSYSIAAADLNGDGNADLIKTNYSDNTVSIMINKGDGTFPTEMTYVTGAGPQSVTVGDLDGDGKADLAVANRNSNNVSIFVGKGDGSFAAAITYTAGSNPFSIIAGDLNDDGKADLAVTNFTSNGSVSVLLNSACASGQTTTTNLVASPNPSCQGTQVTFTAAVTGSSNSAITQGGVTFTQGSTILADSIPVDAGGKATFATDTLAAGSHTIVATYKAAQGFITSTDTLIQTVNARPTGAISGGATYCTGSSTTTALTLIVTGSGILSGGLSDGTTFSGTAPKITVSVSPTATTTYTITSLSDGNCTAQSSDLSGNAKVTVNARPDAPASSGDQVQCAQAPVQTLTATATTTSGNTIMWYNTITGGSVVANPTLNNVGSVTYYAQASNGSCTSATRTAVTLTIKQTPAAPAVTVVNNCGSSTLTAINYTGSLQWTNYNNVTTPSITPTAAGTYYVTQTVNGCTSAQGSGTAAPKVLPTAPSVTVVNNCGSSTLTAGNYTGSLMWNTGATTAAITVYTANTYTVTQTVNGCTSMQGSGMASPKAALAAPVVTVVNNCGYSILSTASKGGLKWSTGDTTQSIKVTKGGTYTVTQTVGSCTSQPGSGTAAPSKPAGLTLTAIITTTSPGTCSALIPFANYVSMSGSPSPSAVYKIGNTVITSPYLFPLGTTTVTVTATNACGFSVGFLVVTVLDNQKPVITCKPGATKTVTGSYYTVQGKEFDATATDNCSVYSLAYSVSGATYIPYSSSNTSLAGKKLNVGTNTVTWTARDGSSNASSCSSVVTVKKGSSNSLIADNVSSLQGNAELSVKLSPVPARSNLLVSLSGFGGKVLMQIFDGNGKQVKQQNWTPLSSQNMLQQNFDVSSLAGGTYLLVVSDGKGNRKTEKFVVSR